MIQYDEVEEIKKIKVQKSITCDCCGKTKKWANGTFESYEAENFICIRKTQFMVSENWDMRKKFPECL